MSQTFAGSLTPILIDPHNTEHVKELTRQRIKCGVSHLHIQHSTLLTKSQWSAEQVPEWIQECVNGQRKHYLYYESSTGLPVGSGGLTTLSHSGAMHVGDALPESEICACSLYIDPDFRGKSYGNIIMEHRHEVAFANPKVEKCILDTLTRFTTLQTWHRRLGYVEYREPTLSFKTFEEIPEHMRRNGETVEDYRISFFELTRERWEEGEKSAREKKNVSHGVGLMKCC